MAWYSRYKQHKACKNKISKEFMSISWHPTRWQDSYMPEDLKAKK